jgi:ferrous iron transport protein B
MNYPPLTIALAGNPNAGKTSLFNALTGAHQHVGNYPGVTVDKKFGTARLDGQAVSVVDLPGTYSLTAYSLEEMVARNYLIGERPDVVVDVVDASNLERNLYLAVQLLELGIPLVICLNMVDVAVQRGLRVDVVKLSKLLGVPVVPTVARKGQGVQALLAAAVELARGQNFWKPLAISYGADVDAGLAGLTRILEGSEERYGLLSARWLALKCLESDAEVLKAVSESQTLDNIVLSVCRRVGEHIKSTTDDDPESLIADYRYGYISAIVRQAVTSEREVRLDFSDKVDKVLTNRLFGPLFLLAVLYGVYEFVFWVSQAPMTWLGVFFGRLSPTVEALLPEGLLRSLLVSGVIDGLGGVLSFVPLIMFMFFAIAAMEDSGYMARMAYLMDKVLRVFGLHGNSVISLIVAGGISGGCAVPAVMATRTLKDSQARLATILVAPFMNCGAKLPVYSLLIGAFFASRRAEVMMALTLISWGLALLTARMLRSTLLRGSQAPFVMELPPYRTPTLKGLLIHTWERTWQYIKKAGIILLAVSIVMWALMTFPGLSYERKEAFAQRIEQAQGEEQKKEIEGELAKETLLATVAGGIGEALTAVTEPVGFDWQTNVALLGGLAAKEVIVATLGTAYSLGESKKGGKGSGEDEKAPVSLGEKLQDSGDWSPLRAFALMIFVMIYSPCVATLAAMRRETGTWAWPVFSVGYNTVMAYVMALLAFQTGRAVGLGG